MIHTSSLCCRDRSQHRSGRRGNTLALGHFLAVGTLLRGRRRATRSFWLALTLERVRVLRGRGRKPNEGIGGALSGTSLTIGAGDAENGDISTRWRDQYRHYIFLRLFPGRRNDTLRRLRSHSSAGRRVARARFVSSAEGCGSVTNCR